MTAAERDGNNAIITERSQSIIGRDLTNDEKASIADIIAAQTEPDS